LDKKYSLSEEKDEFDSIFPINSKNIEELYQMTIKKYTRISQKPATIDIQIFTPNQ